MQVLFDGDIEVHYGFLNVVPESAEVGEHLLDARGGQRNGLCGARLPGCLSMVTGLHTGPVPVRVEVHADAAEVDELWEEVVEVSVTLRDDEPYLLSAFDEWHELVGLPTGPHRAHWSASGMDAGKEMDCPGEGERAPDRYLLQLWPAPAAPDTVLRQTSEVAAYWHEVAATRPAPQHDDVTVVPEVVPDDDEPSDGSSTETDASRLAVMLAAWRESPIWLEMWGGRAPHGELAEWDERAARLAPHDRDLLDDLVTLDPARQRSAATWAARRACARAGIDALPWVADALDRLADGRPLAGPWANGSAHNLLPRSTEESTGYTVVTTVGPGAVHERIAWAADVTAVDAVLGASDPHAGVAAAVALGALLDAYDDVDEGLEEVRAVLADPAG